MRRVLRDAGHASCVGYYPQVAFGTGERRAANDAQVLDFFRGYERQWRLSKILMVRSLLRDRAGVKGVLEEGLGGAEAFSCDDPFLYGPITDGLIFAAASELAMLSEDILALMKFVRSRQFFAKEIVHYRAGAVKDVVGVLASAPVERILSAFMIPVRSMLGDAPKDEVAAAYDAGVGALVLAARSVGRIHKEYEFIYNQYKHGLTIALRPFGGGPLSGEAIDERKKHIFGVPVCYEAEGISTSMKKRPSSPGLSLMLHRDIVKSCGS
jgi:hypothetical protein